MTVLRLEVLTPGATVIDQEIDSLVAPLTDGWRGILAGHAGFQARLMPGEVFFKAQGRRRMLATLGGTLTMDGKTVNILSGLARLDCDLESLERNISAESEQLAAMETAAERHFDRVYRQMAHTLAHRRRRFS
jgi:F0F1-type ATP synthase epsilon subunit